MFSWKMTNFQSQICFNIYYLQKFYLNEELSLYYSQTYIRRPLFGPLKSGPFEQVVVL